LDFRLGTEDSDTNYSTFVTPNRTA